MADKRDAYLQGLEHRKQQHVAATRGHLDRPAAEMGDDELERETKRLRWEKTKADTELSVARRDAALVAGDNLQYGLASNRSAHSRKLADVLNDLKTSRRPRWR